MLKVGGENVAAIEVESFLATHPRSRWRRSSACPTSTAGGRRRVRRAGAGAQRSTAEEVIEYCAGQIASFKVPRYVRFVTEWPMSATKIQKFRLRDELLSELHSDAPAALEAAPGSATLAMFEVGVGLWTMRSTAARPAGVPDLYARLRADVGWPNARFHSLWLAEHHFWYDGWCPATVTAAAAVLGATTRLRAGTGIQLLSLWERECIASAVRRSRPSGQPSRARGGPRVPGRGVRRIRLLPPRSRPSDGPRLDSLTAGLGQARRAADHGRRLRDVALRRAGSRGLGVFLPFSMSLRRLRDTIERYREIDPSRDDARSRRRCSNMRGRPTGVPRLQDARAVIAASAASTRAPGFP